MSSLSRESFSGVRGMSPFSKASLPARQNEESRAVNGWNLASARGPLGTGALAKFQPFTALLSSFCLAGREAFEKGLIPRTPENDSLLNELIGERDIFLSSIQSRNDRENRADVDRLKERVRRLQLGDEL